MMRRNKQQCKTFYEGMLFKTNNDGDLIDPRAYEALMKYEVEITD